MKTVASTYRVQPAILQGNLDVPPSKSITHRALLMAALSRRPVRIRRILDAEDTRLTLDAIHRLGYEFIREGDTVTFTGVQHPPAEHPVTLFVGNSGTTARLITAVAAIQPVPVVIDGTPRMRQRPMAPLFDALRQLGVTVEDTGGYLPLTLSGGKIVGNRVAIDPRASSQFVSALMLIAPLLPQGLRIHLTHPPSSRSYIELTQGILHRFGVPTTWENSDITIPAAAPQPPDEFTVEGDFSSASYALIGAHLTGGKICATNLHGDSLQGDREILSILAASGAKIHHTGNGICVEGTGKPQPVEWDMQHCPDLVPGVAVMCLFASGPSVLKQVSHLRFKESDRIEATCKNAERLGGKVTFRDGHLYIHPGPLHGGTIEPYNDHRIAMAFALAGLRVPGVDILNPDCVEKSYPQFWEHLESVSKPRVA